MTKGGDTGDVSPGLGQGTEREAKAGSQRKLSVLSSMKRWQNQTSNKLRGGGGGGPEARLTELGSEKGHCSSVTVSEVCPWLRAMVLVRMFLRQQTSVHSSKAGDGGQVSYLSCPVWRQHQPSVREPLPPEPLYHMR